MENENQVYQEPVYETEVEPAYETEPVYETVVEDANATPFAQPEKKKMVLDIVCLVCGILSIILGCCASLLSPCCGTIGILPAIAAIVLAFITKSKSEDKKFSGYAKAGLICGIVGILSFVFALVLLIGGASLSAIMNNM